MKKIILTIILISLILMLTGCASVTYSTINGVDGSLTYEIRIKIDEDNINKAKALTAAEETARELYELNEFRTIEVDRENYEIILKEFYPSLTDYYKANNITGDEIEEDDTIAENKGLYTYYTTSTDTAFNSENIDQIAAYVNNKYYMGEGDIADVDMAFKYGVLYKSISSDAESIEEVDGVYYHTFNIDSEKRDRVINITSKSPNAPIWYALCIGLALIAGFVVYLIYRQKKTKIKPQSSEDVFKF